MKIKLLLSVSFAILLIGCQSNNSGSKSIAESFGRALGTIVIDKNTDTEFNNYKQVATSKSRCEQIKEKCSANRYKVWTEKDGSISCSCKH